MSEIKTKFFGEASYIADLFKTSPRTIKKAIAKELTKQVQANVTAKNTKTLCSP